MVEPTRFSYAESELIDGEAYVIWFRCANSTKDMALVEYYGDENVFCTIHGDVISPLTVHHAMHIPNRDYLFFQD